MRIVIIVLMMIIDGEGVAVASKKLALDRLLLVCLRSAYQLYQCYNAAQPIVRLLQPMLHNQFNQLYHSTIAILHRKYQLYLRCDFSTNCTNIQPTPILTFAPMLLPYLPLPKVPIGPISCTDNINCIICIVYTGPLISGPVYTPEVY